MSDSCAVLARARAQAALLVVLLVTVVVGLVAAPAGAAAAGPHSDALAALARSWQDARAAVTLDRLGLGAAQATLATAQAAYDTVDATVAAGGPTRRLDPRDGSVGSRALFDARDAALAARDQAATGVALRGAALIDATQRATAAEDAVVGEVRRRGHVDAPRLRAAWDAAPDADLDVVAFALAQAGKPYVFAAAGPDAYDCSGLTMAAWATQGAHLAHFAATQYGQTVRVHADDLRPGDLVFFGDDLGHVGLYLGGHLMVHAPHTGDVVRIASVNGRDAMRTGRVRIPSG